MRLLKNNRVVRVITPARVESAAPEPVPVTVVAPPDPRIDALADKLGTLADYLTAKRPWVLDTTFDNDGFAQSVSATNGLKNWKFDILRTDGQPKTINATPQ